MQQHEARAFWLREPGAGEIRPVRLAPPAPDEINVATSPSGERSKSHPVA